MSEHDELTSLVSAILLQIMPPHMYDRGTAIEISRDICTVVREGERKRIREALLGYEAMEAAAIERHGAFDYHEGMDHEDQDAVREEERRSTNAALDAIGLTEEPA